jgi:hypothetical protein
MNVGHRARRTVVVGAGGGPWAEVAETLAFAVPRLTVADSERPWGEAVAGHFQADGGTIRVEWNVVNDAGGPRPSNPRGCGHPRSDGK